MELTFLNLKEYSENMIHSIFKLLILKYTCLWFNYIIILIVILNIDRNINLTISMYTLLLILILSTFLYLYFFILEILAQNNCVLLDMFEIDQEKNSYKNQLLNIINVITFLNMIFCSISFIYTFFSILSLLIVFCTLFTFGILSMKLKLYID